MSHQINPSQATQAALALAPHYAYSPARSASNIRRWSLLLLTFVIFGVVIATVISKAMMA